MIEGRLGTAPERSSLVLLAARLILEEALEGEVRDRIGRERYERPTAKQRATETDTARPDEDGGGHG